MSNISRQKINDVLWKGNIATLVSFLRRHGRPAEERCVKDTNEGQSERKSYATVFFVLVDSKG
jgi:hypothetical protein